MKKKKNKAISKGVICSYIKSINRCYLDIFKNLNQDSSINSINFKEMPYRKEKRKKWIKQLIEIEVKTRLGCIKDNLENMMIYNHFLIHEIYKKINKHTKFEI